jgi:DtxR family Mn-dependent transcriptional regulator
MSVSYTEENYLKAIYKLENSSSGTVNTTLLSSKIKTKASSVTDMVQKLADKDLVSYKKYKGVKLTSSGKKIAIETIRKHRLWEVFLVEKLQYNWDEVHDLAEQLEHIHSDSLTDRLDAFLEFPEYDPHGDPIPKKNGTIVSNERISLFTAKPTQKYVIVGVKDSSAAFLKFLNKSNIQLGAEIKILSKEPFDNSMIISVNGIEVFISELISKNLYVQII